MGTMQIEIPRLPATGQSPEEFAKESSFLLALKLFELGRVSSGRAAALCGLERVDFLFAAGKMGVPVVDLDSEEMTREFTDA